MGVFSLDLGDRDIMLLVISCCCIFMVLRREAMVWKRAKSTDAAYYVKNLPDADAAAEHLARLHQHISTFLDRAREKVPGDARLQRITERWSGTLSEIPGGADNVAYSLGKNTIHICVREKDGKLADMNTSLFVLLHELAHVATDSYGHTKEFWKNMKFLLELAEEVGIYTYVNHDETVETLCGRVLGTNPLSCVKNKTCLSERKNVRESV